MQSETSFKAIGKIIKPHGFKGELTLKIYDEFNGILDELNFIHINFDGAYIPYSFGNLAPKNNGHYKLALDDVLTEQEALQFKSKEVFTTLEIAEAFNPDHDEDKAFDSFQIIDKNLGLIGRIGQLESYSGNQVVQVITDSDEELLLPLHEDFIESIDEIKQTIYVNFPEGMIELND